MQFNFYIILFKLSYPLLILSINKTYLFLDNKVSLSGKRKYNDVELPKHTQGNNLMMSYLFNHTLGIKFILPNEDFFIRTGVTTSHGRIQNEIQTGVYNNDNSMYLGWMIGLGYQLKRLSFMANYSCQARTSNTPYQPQSLNTFNISVAYKLF
ncbi:hypothetical protein [Flammeovirga agarivorans]|uniref:Outer membrane protein beta-barrel domain-containing protein n=1 Tax=Flammeovirga agarivorans TaxID=2726742 RepID=A0A7X8XXW4_9BACT|nr:hypothetical protein [Flammeovirga agarivorans]NLR93455.1 hypothetical protein [Flammeovirga agarivorans]